MDILEILELLEGVKMPNRMDPEYCDVFNDCAKGIYEMTTKRNCPETVKVSF